MQDMLAMNVCVTNFDAIDRAKVEKYVNILYKLDMTKYFLQIVSSEVVSKLVRFFYHTFNYIITSYCVNQRRLVQKVIDVQNHNLWLFFFIVSFYVFI